MKKKILILIIFIFTITVSASNKFTIKNIKLNREEEIINKLPEENKLSYKIDYEDENKEIIDLSKKITYLLLGPSNKDETSEEYYKRHKDFLKPVIPTKNGNPDTNSQEYKDDIVSSFTVSTMFITINEMDINYSTFGDINVSKSNDLVLKNMHNQASSELSAPRKLNNMAYRNWNKSAYKYNEKRKGYEFRKELGRSNDVPKFIKVEV